MQHNGLAISPVRLVDDACNNMLADTQALLNMAMVHDIALQLEKEGAPNHIHGMNLARIRISSMEHDPTPGAHPIACISCQLSDPEKLMRMPEEPPPEPKGGSAKSNGTKGRLGAWHM